MSRSLENIKHHERNRGLAPDVDVDEEHDPEVSRRASMADLERHSVQMKGGKDVPTDQVHAAAEQGVASPTTKLPFAEQIQQSFGAGHDVSAIQAHVGGKSADAMGATAFATGNHVVFDKHPDLHTAAHEAAHVVQQARGVNLYGGVGDAGDRYEQNADAVADRVVAGQSAADLLGASTRGMAPAATGPVQQKKKDVAETTKDERDDQHEKAELSTFWAVQNQLKLVAAKMHRSAKQVEQIVSMTEFDEAGGEPEAQTLAQVYEDAKSELFELHSSLQVAGPDVAKWLHSQIHTELGQLYGGTWRVIMIAHKADSFLMKRHHKTPCQTIAGAMNDKLSDIFGIFGRTHQDIKRDSHELAGGVDKADSEAIKQTLDALYQNVHAARMDSSYDLENGHKQVIMASHRAKEAKELLTESGDKKKAKKYKPELAKIAKEIDKLSDESPNLYMDIKSTGLAETVAALQKIK